MFIRVGSFTANKASGLKDGLGAARVRGTLMLLHRQTRGHSDTSTHSWLVCCWTSLPEAGGLRARRPFGRDLFKQRRPAAQSKVPASVWSGSRMKDGRDRDPSFCSDLSPH